MHNIFGYTLGELTEFVVQLGAKPFHAKQIFKWMHAGYVTDFAHMTDLSKVLRSQLAESAIIKFPGIFSESFAADGVIKWLIAIDDNNKVEMVFIPDDKRGTLCISSQIGCALDCKFCCTGRQGFNRNLSVAEILSQLWLARSRLQELYLGASSITNIVMMGMGEPLANYDNVVNAVQIMLHDSAYNISRHKLTISTSGIVPAILKLKDSGCAVKLAVSLHASNDQVRSKIMSINDKYPIAELLSACLAYLQSTREEFITFEYVMLQNVNDDLEFAHELLKLVKGVPCKFNLIPFNPFVNSGFECSDWDTILRFQKILRDGGIITTIRKTRGDKINAACGQLSGDILDKTKRRYTITPVVNV